MKLMRFALKEQQVQITTMELYFEELKKEKVT